MTITLPESHHFSLLILLLPLVFHSLEHKHRSTVSEKSLHMSLPASNFSGNFDLVSVTGFRASGHATKPVRIQGVSGCCSVMWFSFSSSFEEHRVGLDRQEWLPPWEIPQWWSVNVVLFGNLLEAHCLRCCFPSLRVVAALALEAVWCRSEMLGSAEESRNPWACAGDCQN